jgi:hypothetical protein
MSRRPHRPTAPRSPFCRRLASDPTIVPATQTIFLSSSIINRNDHRVFWCCIIITQTRTDHIFDNNLVDKPSRAKAGAVVRQMQFGELAKIDASDAENAFALALKRVAWRIQRPRSTIAIGTIQTCFYVCIYDK